MRPEAVQINRLVVASGSRGCTNTLLPRHSILYDELPAATSVTGSANSMMLKWFGAVSTRITLCRSDFSVSILWALAVSAMAMVKAMVFCMPKFPAIPASRQKTRADDRPRAEASGTSRINAWQALRDSKGTPKDPKDAVAFGGSRSLVSLVCIQPCVGGWKRVQLRQRRLEPHVLASHSSYFRPWRYGRSWQFHTTAIAAANH